MLARALAIALLAAGSAEGGTLDHGNWSPSGCGPEPTAPSGLNLSSPAAYKESVKWVKAYQDAFTAYSDCMVHEANDDNAAINDYVRGRQKKAQEFFDKASADSKRAQETLGGPVDANRVQRGHVGMSSSMPQ